MIKYFLTGFVFSLFMIFVAIPSMFMEDTSRDPLTLSKIQQFYRK